MIFRFQVLKEWGFDLSDETAWFWFPRFFPLTYFWNSDDQNFLKSHSQGIFLANSFLSRWSNTPLNHILIKQSAKHHHRYKKEWKIFLKMIQNLHILLSDWQFGIRVIIFTKKKSIEKMLCKIFERSRN